jgi:hypothetical protein
MDYEVRQLSVCGGVCVRCGKTEDFGPVVVGCGNAACERLLGESGPAISLKFWIFSIKHTYAVINHSVHLA